MDSDVDDGAVEEDADTASADNVSQTAEPEDTPDHVPEGSSSKTSVEQEVHQERKAKSAKRRQKSPEHMQRFSAMASSATKMLSQIASSRKQGKEVSDDKDWDFCRFIYHKIKDVPDGDEKDEMQLAIQQIIAHAKKRCVSMQQHHTSVLFSSGNIMQPVSELSMAAWQQVPGTCGGVKQTSDVLHQNFAESDNMSMNWQPQYEQL